VFQKALLRATANAWAHASVVGAGTQKEFLDKWLAFLDAMDKRGVFAIKASLNGEAEADRLWLGISLNIVSESVRYNEAAVERIASVLLLWWYFYEKDLSKVRSFIKRLDSKRAATEFPEGDACIATIRQGVQQVIKARNVELTLEAESKLVEERLRAIILKARRSDAASAGTETETDAEADAETEVGEEPVA
jgi:hypothetical protein